MKLKNVLFISLLLLIGSMAANAEDQAFRVPISNNRISDPGLKSVGVNNVVLVTSTNAELATDSDGDTITDGLVYWVAFSTASSLFVAMRDTDTANTSSTKLMPYITRGSYNVSIFDPPIPFSNGLSLNLGPASATPSGGYDDIAVGVRWQK